MKWFKNKKIAFKLISTFLIIALIAGGVGVFGIISLTNANTQNAAMFENYGNSQGYLGYVMSDFSTQRSNYRDIIMLADSQDTKTYADKISASNDDMNKYLAKFKQTCVTAEDMADYNTLETALNGFVTMRDSIVAAAQNGDYTKANEILRADDSLQAVNNAQSAVDKAVTDNIQAASAALAAENANTSSVTIILIVIAVIAVGLAIGIGIFLTNIIAKPLNHLSSWARRLAEGDGTLEKTAFQQKDEVGEIFDSVRAIRDTIQKLTMDVDMLTEAAIEGKLSVRADASKHQGEYRKIIEGVNGTLNAIVTPVNEATTVLREIEGGDLSARVTSDFVGDYAIIKNTMNSMAEVLTGYINEISYTLGELSNGNLDVEIISDYRGDFEQIKESINGIIASLNDTMMEINTAADQVSAGAHQVSDGVQETSQGATEQASSIEELTASISQIAQQTKQNAMSANKANELTVSAVSNAAHGNEQMKTMQQAMSEISESSRNINKIIKVIDDIAFQTNILALNAAVEAARAGVHGKGFAVVAEEVRNLAARSANAAKETTDLIEGSIRKTEAGTKIADETAGALTSIVEGVDKAAQLVSEIASASNEQAGAIAQVNNGIEQMSQVVQTNSATAEEGAAASEELSSQAELLKSMIGKFRLKAGSEEWKTSEQVMAAHKSDGKPKTHIINMSDADFGKY